MCGIVGIVKREDSVLSHSAARDIFVRLLLESQSRGKDSSGLASLRDECVEVCKAPASASRLISSGILDEVLRNHSRSLCLMGHARMETDGTFSCQGNNHPIVRDNILVIHNGIIVNHKELFASHSDIRRDLDVDTEIIPALLGKLLSPGNPVESASEALRQLQGSFSCAIMFAAWDWILVATNTGSLHILEGNSGDLLCFSSERRFLQRLFEKKLLVAETDSYRISQLRPGTGLFVHVRTLKQHSFSFSGQVLNRESFSFEPVRTSRPIKFIEPRLTRVNQDRRLANREKHSSVESSVLGEYEKLLPRVDNLRRCTRCILPETMPFIQFDRDGVCNYCRHHLPRETRGHKALEEAIAPFKMRPGEPNCILSFSGGRDSSYALHYVKRCLGLSPVAYSYDWGMLTDLGRRNQARMTGRLGVEHILVSADIQRKRKYIRRNVLAWLHKPDIGMVPLFMAGDKQYFYHLNSLRRRLGIDLVIYADNALEKTDFKYGFAGVELTPQVGKAYDIGLGNSLRLLWFYFSRYASNLRYLNSSLIDSFTAYISSYFIPKDYLYLYRYILWDEKEIERTLVQDYDWEVSPDTGTTWRIGDGTASFYNYIYYTATGFTENDTFRSNQIREGAIDRDAALARARIDNKPRVDSLLWYFNTIGVDPVLAVKKINSMRKFY